MQERTRGLNPGNSRAVESFTLPLRQIDYSVPPRLTTARIVRVTLISILASLSLTVALNQLFRDDHPITGMSIMLGILIPTLIAPTASFVFYSLIDRLNDVNRRLAELNSLDPLTGILNRREFYSLAEQDLHLAARHGVDLSLLMMDLDHFKSVNDTHGHRVGDLVLDTFTQAVSMLLRDSDRFGRYGGEEFIILLHYSDNPVRVAERIRSTVQHLTYPSDASDVQITVSLGCAHWHSPDETIEQLIDRADNALYAAKKLGRNRVAIDDTPQLAIVRTRA